MASFERPPTFSGRTPDRISSSNVLPNEGPQVCTSTNVFETRGPAPPNSSGKDSGASDRAAVPAAAEYPEKLAAGLERSVPVRAHFLPSAGGNRPDSALEPNSFQ